MRIFVPGNDPRSESVRQLLVNAGHESLPSAAGANVVMCCQPSADGGPVFRHDTLQLLREIAPQLTAPAVICLLSFEPNIIWPVGFCHAARTTLRFATPVACPMTRAHVRGPLLGKLSELVLGADTPEATATLQEIWQPVAASQEPLPVSGVYRAEAAAEYKS